MLQINKDGQFIAKIIDFGSGYMLDQNDYNGDISTPEYLPPEILERSEKISSHNWSIDIWSLGIILIELIVGFPVWMSYKGRIVKNG